MAGKMIAVAAGLLVLSPSVLAAQQVSARDAFWSASDLISVTPNPAVHKRAAAQRHAPPAARAQSPEASSETATAEPQGPRVVKAVRLVSENGYGAAPHLVQAANDRLGLRCSILLRGLDGRYLEVAPGSLFHSGDHIRLGLLANEPGYIYVIARGSTGAWSPIYPPPGSTANKIAAGEMQMVPGGTQAFAFDQNPGDEKLFVILSRAPIEDIDRAIQGLKGRQPTAAPPQTPAGDSTTLIAENKIPEFFVQQLASRDLTLIDEQKVNDSSSAGGGEKAIYVVSKASGPDSAGRVVLKLDLRHE